MKVASEEWISELIEMTRVHLNEAESFAHEDLSKLNNKASDKAWSVLECLEHLNLYGDFYIPELTSRIADSKSKPEETFSPGWLGNYFAQGMIPKEGMKTMNTFNSKNPNGSNLDKGIISRFIDQQKTMLRILDDARRVSLGKIRTSISISTIIKIKLGDTLRFVVYHNWRHMEQAKVALRNQPAEFQAENV
jgi:hypothetical protein